jgi:hypothetical protein
MTHHTAMYLALGMYSALVTGELEFRRRILPEDHPEIGKGHVWSDALYVCFRW